MYEIEKAFENTAFLVNFILQLALLIIFLRMAWNIGRIRKFIVQESYDLLLDEAYKFEFKEKNEEAIDKYMDYIYLVKNANFEKETKISMIKPIIKSIESLGGKIPESLQTYLK